MRNSRATNEVVGAVVSLTGGGLVLLAYFVLPVVSVPFVGSVTAPALAQLTPEATSLILLPAVPVAAIAAVLLSGWILWLRPPERRRRIGAIALIVAAAVTALAYLVPLLRLQSELGDSGLSSSLGVYATTFTGVGFWAGLVGAIMVGIGGVLEFNRSRDRELSSV
jgi:hypothetical protein